MMIDYDEVPVVSSGLGRTACMAGGFFFSSSRD
jgi:hypothetical protein